ncbi:hypothetical protein I7I53_11384 [Histoplasma capsulatum var. duboisii H88]|uniref:HNH nuclease domain-containing protein n=1 Tax=Ajellomyces capsulatus (strain H88) TaxID=544711 RepID=A0A8A1L9J4_AJEC8|nr:hypothetical protein I7I53_11384 [Histoplasma capsulatum var. duboisii H88]
MLSRQQCGLVYKYAISRSYANLWGTRETALHYSPSLNTPLYPYLYIGCNDLFVIGQHYRQPQTLRPLHLMAPCVETIDSQKNAMDTSVLTNVSLCEVAHIFPHCMINEMPPQTSLTAAIPPFWKLLRFFFEPDRLNRWRAEIFKDPSNPTQTADGCQNMICLDPTAHEMWSRGQFALRPVSMSDDCKELTVQFYWQPKPPHDRFDSVNIQRAPGSSRDLSRVGGNYLAIFNNTDFARAIKSGDTFIFRTANPDTHPLPSFELLDMQWCLQRIVSMSGAADVYDEEDGDGDDDDGGEWHREIVHKSISEWDIYSWVPPPPSDSASSEGDELDIRPLGQKSSITTSAMVL